MQGAIVGPPLASDLKSMLGDDNVAVQGIDYAAAVGTNLSPGNADPQGVFNMRSLFMQAAQKCPQTKILASGYSQGAAIVHGAMEDLPATIMSQIAGVALFGDTRNLQERGRVAGYPEDQTLIICNPGDLVCSGTLTILPPHLAYGPRVPEASRFLVRMVQGAGADGAAGNSGRGFGRSAGRGA